MRDQNPKKIKEPESSLSNEITISEENIYNLINEAVSVLGQERIYEMAMSEIDPDEYKSGQEKGMTADRIGMIFSIAGFITGIKYTLSNITIHQN